MFSWLALPLSSPHQSLYANELNDGTHTVRGRADANTQVTLSDQNGNEWPAGANSERDWSVTNLNFESLYGKSDKYLTFSATSGDVTSRVVTATYDVTDPTSTAESPGDDDGTSCFHITWEADDAFSGVGLVELWCKKEDLAGNKILRDWSPTYYTRYAKGEHQIDGDFYYEIPEAEKYEDGRYFFGVKCFDVAGNEEPRLNPVVTFDYIAPASPGGWPNGYSGLEGGGGGCFIATAASD